MELRQLKYFVKVAETLNFSEAAKILYVTQSTLSQQIKQLEQDLDTRLLIRTSHSVALTEAGAELLPYARRTIQDAELCTARIEDLKQALGGTLNIGVTYSFSPILTETLVSFMKLFPKVKLNIFYRPMTELMDMLRCREVDFALAFKPSQPIPDVVSHILFQTYIAAIVGQSHPIATKERISLSDLANYDLALPAKGLQARNALESILNRYPCDLHIRVELNEVNILLKLIRQNRLATILAEATIHNETGLKAIPIDIPESEMAGCIHTLKNSYHKRSMQEFIRLLSESAAIRERVNAWL
ncbi:MAG: LysR family transcriptional regulator [Muribaculaceae bacterium]|nr:LysR family transcriptional regulator [Muribaculaceae bacterium]